VQETAGHVRVLSVECRSRGKYWRLRLLLTCRELVQVVESEQAWYSIRGAWNELVPGLVAVCVHRWVRLPHSIGLFRCAGCAERAVCPGCLNSLNIALVAADAGFTVAWCKAHITSGSVSDEN
jgi:hypothetical protein